MGKLRSYAPTFQKRASVGGARTKSDPIVDVKCSGRGCKAAYRVRESLRKHVRSYTCPEHVRSRAKA